MDILATHQVPSQPYLPLFVYGTLMRGERAHCLISAQLERASQASLQGAALFDLGRYPIAVRAFSSISGELIWLAEDTYDITLETLDRYEGPEYVRRPIEVQLPGVQESTLAWVYLGKETPATGAVSIPHGDWRRWQEEKRT